LRGFRLDTVSPFLNNAPPPFLRLLLLDILRSFSFRPVMTSYTLTSRTSRIRVPTDEQTRIVLLFPPARIPQIPSCALVDSLLSSACRLTAHQTDSDHLSRDGAPASSRPGSPASQPASQAGRQAGRQPGRQPGRQQAGRVGTGSIFPYVPMEH